MPSVELCQGGLILRLVTEDEKCFLQIAEAQEDTDHWVTPNPDNLFSVLNGLRYHLSAGNSLCSLHREQDEIVLEYQSGNRPIQTCRIALQRFRAALQAAFRENRCYLA